MPDMPTGKQPSKNKEQTSPDQEKDNDSNPAITTKTIVKNAHATGNGTTGEHDGEHDAFKDETEDTPPLDGADQY